MINKKFRPILMNKKFNKYRLFMLKKNDYNEYSPILSSEKDHLYEYI